MEITKVVKRFVENKKLSYKSGCYVIEDPKQKIYEEQRRRENVRNITTKECTEYEVKILEIEIRTRKQFGDEDVVRRIERVTFCKNVTKGKEFMCVRLHPSDEKVLKESIRYVKSLRNGEISERHVPESTNKEQREYTKKYRRGLEVYIPKRDYQRYNQLKEHNG